MKKHVRGQRFHSNEDVRNEVKKWLRAQDVFFSVKDLTNWYIATISVWTDLVTMWRSKANGTVSQPRELVCMLLFYLNKK
jgi:hypothetical protein